MPHKIISVVYNITILGGYMVEDYSHTLLEDEERHFHSCVADVLDAFKTHGTNHILQEVAKNTVIKQQLSKVLQELDN